MSRSASLMIALLGVMLTLPASAWAQQQQGAQRPKLTRGEQARTREGDFVVDEQGRRFRVAFPLYDRFALGADVGLLPGAVPSEQELGAWGARLTLHRSLSLDFEDEDVWWMMRHALLDTTLRAASGEQGGVLVESTLVQARYLRHDLNSFVVIPSANDLRLPANFDIATDYRLLHLRATRVAGEWSVSRLDLVDIALMGDLIRDPSYRHRFAIGFAGRYHTRPDAAGWQHELAPLSEAKLLYGWDQRDGRLRVYGEAVCGGALGFQGGAGEAPPWQWGCRGEGVLEWVPLAISDRPLSIPLEVRADIPLDSTRERALQVTLGLRLAWPI